MPRDVRLLLQQGIDLVREVLGSLDRFLIVAAFLFQLFSFSFSSSNAFDNRSLAANIS